MDQNQPIKIETTEHSMIISLDDGKVNAFSHEMIKSIQNALDTAETEAKALLIQGRPGLFSAGYDLKTIKAGEAQKNKLMSEGCALCLRLLTWPRPVVYAVTGHAMALGGILLLGGDYRIGLSGDYKVGLNEVAIGMPMPHDGIIMANFRINQKWRHRCVNQAEVLDIPNATDAGFLDAVADTTEQLHQNATETVNKLAQLPMDAYRETKMRLRKPYIEAVQQLT